MLHYVRKGEGLVLVLVHGYLSSAAYWKPQIDYFARQFDVIAVDLPGFGDSHEIETPNTIEGLAEPILKLLNFLGIGHFFLIGHSMGGMVVHALTLIAKGQVDRLVLYGTGPVGALPDRFEPIDRSCQRVKTDGIDAAADHIVPTWFLKGTEARFYDLCRQSGAQTTEQAGINGLLAVKAWNGTERLAEIACPTLIVWGEADRSYGWGQPHALWKNIPNASLFVVPGCAHNVHLEVPDLFNGVVKSFLSSTLA